MEGLPELRGGPHDEPVGASLARAPSDVADRDRSRDTPALNTAAPTRPAAVGLSVVIPVYNEQATIVEVIWRVLAQSLVTEVLVVNDGSTDETASALGNVTWPPIVRLLTHARNQGKGAAIRTGVAATTQAVIIVQDADLEYDPADYPAILRPILAGQADVVYGSRFLLPRPYAFWLDLANRCLTLATNVLYGVRLTDMETCYKAFRAEVLQRVRIRSDRFDFEPEITAKVLRQHLRIVEVPIAYQRRGYAGGKKIGMRDGFMALWALLRFRFRD
ncbi:MAG: glycosyltransferase family 2 protein [Ktedonobacterales bacterium]